MSFPVLLIIYCAVLAVEVFANATRDVGLQYFSKPLLMPVLIFYYAANARKSVSARYLILSALLFSWLGDLLLLIDKTRGSFFIYGLAAFLTAHIFYVFYFFRMRKLNRVRERPNAFIYPAIAVYSLAFFAYLAPSVESLLLPVAVYALVISLMLASSIGAFDLEKNASGRVSIAGTLLFVVSDSVLAVNRFVAPFEYAPVFIMLTYAFAQLLITEGSVRNFREI